MSCQKIFGMESEARGECSGQLAKSPAKNHLGDWLTWKVSGFKSTMVLPSYGLRKAESALPELAQLFLGQSLQTVHRIRPRMSHNRQARSDVKFTPLTSLDCPKGVGVDPRYVASARYRPRTVSDTSGSRCCGSTVRRAGHKTGFVVSARVC